MVARRAHSTLGTIAKRAVDLLPPYFLRDLFQSTEMKVSELVLFKLLLKLTDSLQQEIPLRKMVKWQDLTLSVQHILGKSCSALALLHWCAGRSQKHSK
jgi:hypothetical protein